MIWSSFLIESPVGRPSVRVAIVPVAVGDRVELSRDAVSNAETGWPTEFVGFRWLLVLVGFVWGEDAGEDVRRIERGV